MSRTGILVVLGVFLVAFLLLGLGKCGYRKIEGLQSLEKASAQMRREYPEVRLISAKTLQLYRDNKIPLLIADVRGEKEFATSHLPGALHFENVKDLRQFLTEQESNPGFIIVYGAIGFRSAKFADQLQEAGTDGVVHLEGGIFDWANRGLPLVGKEGDSTELVHQYNRIWGRLLKEEHRLPLEEER